LFVCFFLFNQFVGANFEETESTYSLKSDYAMAQQQSNIAFRRADPPAYDLRHHSFRSVSVRYFEHFFTQISFVFLIIQPSAHYSGFSTGAASSAPAFSPALYSGVLADAVSAPAFTPVHYHSSVASSQFAPTAEVAQPHNSFYPLDRQTQLGPEGPIRRRA
jgi:hypothetical protein